jgi:hypothetical protein
MADAIDDQDTRAEAVTPDGAGPSPMSLTKRGPADRNWADSVAEAPPKF